MPKSARRKAKLKKRSQSKKTVPTRIHPTKRDEIPSTVLITAVPQAYHSFVPRQPGYNPLQPVPPMKLKGATHRDVDEVSSDGEKTDPEELEKRLNGVD